MKALQLGHMRRLSTAFIVAVGTASLAKIGFGMSKTEEELRRDLLRICRLIYEKGWVAMNDGNISIRLDDDRILCTPTAVSKGFVEVEDLIVCDGQGRKVAGARAGTSELAMHLTVYSLRPDVRSVVHAHPPTATGW